MKEDYDKIIKKMRLKKTNETKISFHTSKKNKEHFEFLQEDEQQEIKEKLNLFFEYELNKFSDTNTITEKSGKVRTMKYVGGK